MPRHVRRHVVGPVTSLPFPEVPVVPVAGSRRRPVDLQAAERVEAAQPRDVRGGPGLLLRRRERLPDEPGQLPHALDGVAQHLLVPQEQHGLGVRLARVPLPEEMVPDRPADVGALARGLELVGEGDVRRELPGEVEHGDDHVLGVPAHVDDFAAGVPGDGGRQDGVLHVRGHEPRRRQRVHLDPASGGEQHLHEGDAVVRVEAAERVPRAAGWVRAARHGCEGQGLEPRGAALGRGHEVDVPAARREALSDGDDPRQVELRYPSACPGSSAPTA